MKLYLGDNMDVLKTLPENSVDSIVTDAPYGLGKEPDAIELLKDWVEKGYHEINGKGFMGKEWDAFVPQPLFWKEAYRVLKPGGYVLSFFGTRTYDWGVMAMRLAGFEVKNCLYWHTAQGFPKSQDISKMMDKALGAEREVVGFRRHPTLKDKSKVERERNLPFHGTNTIRDEWEITAPASNEARKWAGYGTALKPATEPIVLARKPISEKTIVQNILKWGVGGLNIDGCRVESSSEDKAIMDKKASRNPTANYSNKEEKIYGAYALDRCSPSNPIGRFPSDLLLECICDEVYTTGEIGKPYEYKGREYNVEGFVEKCVPNSPSNYNDKAQQIIHTDPNCPCFIMEQQSAGASRFFFVAKASSSEKDEGLEHLELKRADGTIVKGENTHISVKPLQLMRYLCRLVTPPNGVILDPFMGSGTTGKAALAEGFDFIGIEMDEDSFKIAELRISSKNQGNLF